ncbi:MAG TPA: 2OG-Fe(II) oxygenase, partial [Deltaproteobacteria bacterium]|nr:2OG-Fe(II) oxygenase [Deltaproteobacteria bacterium]
KNSQGQWIDVPFIKDSFVMNIGDMLHRWSNGLLISTPHRVKNCTGRERYSCPFFFEPNVNVNVSPLPCCINDHRPKQFESIDYGEFLRTELQTGYDRHAVHN